MPPHDPLPRCRCELVTADVAVTLSGMDGPEWHSPASYALGDRVSWQGAELVCTRAHYAGPEAHHPWDAGSGWGPAAAALLFTPATEAARARLTDLGSQCPAAGRCAAYGFTEPIPRS